MECALRALGRARVVRDHHDGLAVITIEGLEQVENFVARLPEQGSCRLVVQAMSSIFL